VGISGNNRKKANAFGLAGMKERVSMLGGELKIDSTQGKGTTLAISIPLP
jgi:signal transduction histidine kinase